MRAIQDHEQAVEVARALLETTGFSSFRLSTQFTLRFCRNRPMSLHMRPLPMEVELDLLGDWWLDDADEWAKKVAELAPPGAVEPEEPVQAYELAALRWTEGTAIESIKLDDHGLSICFQNGRVLTASAALKAEGPAWALYASTEWSVVSDRGALFVRAPFLEGDHR